MLKTNDRSDCEDECRDLFDGDDDDKVDEQKDNWPNEKPECDKIIKTAQNVKANETKRYSFFCVTRSLIHFSSLLGLCQRLSELGNRY
jgi:hypothetical protein